MNRGTFIYRKTKHHSGFTLIELSIVILVMGLFIIATTAGYSLIGKASLRGVITESRGFISAINTFEQKYGSLPGDFPNASDIWGTECAPIPTDCNGNGDGVITYSMTSLTQNEALRAWQTLALAQMITGNYTGVATVAGETDIGINGPASQYNNGGWSIYNCHAFSPPICEGQYLWVGGFHAGNPTDNPLFIPTSAYNIDLKIDDGYPRNGLVWGDNLSMGCFPSISITTPYSVGSGMCILDFIFRKDIGLNFPPP